MISIKNFGRTALSIISAVFFGLLSVLTVGTEKQELPSTPETFEPVLRFVACSDLHFKNNNETEALGEEGGEEYEAYLKKVVVPPARLKKTLETAYSYAESSSYKNLDAFVVAGDFTDYGAPEQYEAFKTVCAENLNDATQLITCTGNHEYNKYEDADNREEGARVYERYMGELNTHYVINGYHFIAVSYDDKVETYLKTSVWLRRELKKAQADTGDKPIFVFQHPAPSGTIYGSVKWGDPVISAVLSEFPQVVDFSGHSHYPINDPRSVWQGTFTALGCGTLSYFETELDTIAGNFPYNNHEAAQFYIVEVDAEGNVCVKPYDLITEKFFDFEYYFTDLAKKNYPYSLQNMSRHDTAPVFENGGNIKTTLNENGETVLTFDGAKAAFVTESYKLTLSSKAKVVFEDNFSGKYMYLFEEDSYEVNLGKLESGKEYTVSLYALSAFAKLSKLQTYTFTA